MEKKDGNMEKINKIAVIGLGLIGGSLSMAAKGFAGAKINGYDLDEHVRIKVLQKGAVDKVCATAKEAIGDAQIVILCTFPKAMAEFIKENAPCFSPGALILDVAGIKEQIDKEIREILPQDVIYIGCHPMAGKEAGTFEMADKELFKNSGFLIILPDNPDKGHQQALQTVKELAQHIGCSQIISTTAAKHDQIIAYTSHLMHLTSAALCMDYPPDFHEVYTAGAFRDITRVARLNPELWADLFLMNKDYLLDEVDKMMQNLCLLRNAIKDENRIMLVEHLSKARQNKDLMNQLINCSSDYSTVNNT